MILAWSVSADMPYDALKHFSEGQDTQCAVSKAPELLPAVGRHFSTGIASNVVLQNTSHQGVKGVCILGVQLGCRVGAKLL